MAYSPNFDNMKDRIPYLNILLLMLNLALAYCVSSCTRTVDKFVETHDTLYVDTSTTDTNTVYTSTTDTLYILRTDTVRISDVRRDSIVVKDSVFVREKGDSVYVYREKWRTNVELRHDTVFRAKTDTVFRAKTDTVTVYRFVERNDSAYHSSQSYKTTVKERRTISWLKVLGMIALVFAGLVAWRKFKK